MECNQINELLSLYIDRMLDENQVREVEEHLASCDSCRKEYNELKEILELLGQTEMVPVPDAFRFRLKTALKEEKQSMIASGAITRVSKKNRWRIITSVAAVFAVGVITLSLYNDILGVLPDRLDGGDQTGAPKTEELYNEPADASAGADDSAVTPNATSDGSVVMKARTSDLQPTARDSYSAAGSAAQNYSADSVNEAAQKNASSEDQMTAYGLADGSEQNNELGMLADGAEPEAAAGLKEKGIGGNYTGNCKQGLPSDECSRSLAAMSVERNAAAVQFYNNLIEDKLKGFDYQVLDSCYAQTGEWKFRIFIFRGKDGNTYNEEILVVGKDGEIKIICSNKLTGL